MARRTIKSLGFLLIMGVALSVFTPQKVQAQYTIGVTGLLNAPSAEMNETGRFMIGGNF